MDHQPDDPPYLEPRELDAASRGTKQIERNAARTLYKIASYVSNNRKPRLGAQQPLKANYVPKLLTLGDHQPYYKHLSRRCREKLRFYLNTIKGHFKERDELKKTVPIAQQKYFYF